MLAACCVPHSKRERIMRRINNPDLPYTPHQRLSLTPAPTLALNPADTLAPPSVPAPPHLTKESA